MADHRGLILFDVIETVFSLDRLGQMMQTKRLPAAARDLFFAQLLRDAFALSATGVFKPFVEVASGTLEVVLANHGLSADETTVRDILGQFGALEPHPDVLPALELARDQGVRVAFLTNGSKANTEKLVAQNGFEPLVDAVISIEDLQVWKPSMAVYKGALERLDGDPESTLMIAAHAWDLQGAAHAGLRTGWVRRQDARFHAAMTAPDVQAESLVEVVQEGIRNMGL